MSHYIRIDIENPAPLPGEPAPSSNDVYRRVAGEVEWVRIATGVAVDGVYDDYAVASGVDYEYKVRAVAAVNGTYADSATSAPTAVEISGAWLHDPSDPAGTEYHQIYDRGSRSDRHRLDRHLLKVAGREDPLPEFGPGREANVPVVWPMPEPDELEALRDLLSRPGTLLYRDSAGRKVFGTVEALDVDDIAPGYSSAAFQVDRTTYSEAV